MSSFGFGGFARPKLEAVAAFAKSVTNDKKCDVGHGKSPERTRCFAEDQQPGRNGPAVATDGNTSSKLQCEVHVQGGIPSSSEGAGETTASAATKKHKIAASKTLANAFKRLQAVRCAYFERCVCLKIPRFLKRASETTLHECIF